jgi:hypothetical protein
VPIFGFLATGTTLPMLTVELPGCVCCFKDCFFLDCGELLPECTLKTSFTLSAIPFSLKLDY